MQDIPEMPHSNEYSITNAYDEMVRNCVWQTMQQMDMCTCEKCFLDACAMVFNNSFSKYVTTREGGLISRASNMNQIEYAKLLVAVTAALKMVKDSPKH